jgi:hypothetical protein
MRDDRELTPSERHRGGERFDIEKGWQKKQLENLIFNHHTHPHPLALFDFDDLRYGKQQPASESQWSHAPLCVMALDGLACVANDAPIRSS